MKKLKHNEIQSTRNRLFKKQKGVCPLCDREIQDAVLDHDHSSGHCRQVLCRLCNSLEGKIENWIKRYGKSVNRVLFLQNLIKYWIKDYSKNPIHPKHKTPEDKKLSQLKRRYKNAKRDSTKRRLSGEIKKLGGTIPRIKGSRTRTRK